jgi:hypothetical protein
MVVEDKEPNYWGLAILISLPILIGLALLITFVGGPLHNLWFGYGWSSDKGNGPEAIQQTVLYAAIAAVLIPAVRRFIKREFGKLHKKIEEGHDEIHAHMHDLADKLGLERFERPSK